MKNFFLSVIITTTLLSCKSSQNFKHSSSKSILGTWVWKESIHVDNKNNPSSPKSTRSRRKIIFTNDGRIITYKNNVEVRICRYKLSKGISIFDQQEHDLITFEGITYVIEKLNGYSLGLANNSSNGYRSAYRR